MMTSGWRVRSGVGAASGLLALTIAVNCTKNPEAPPPGAPSDELANVPVGGAGWAPGRPGLTARRATGQAEFGEAIRTLETAGSACGMACPPLQTLRVAVRHICSVADTKDDEASCKEARAALVTNLTRLHDCKCKEPVDAGVDASDDAF